MLAVARSIVGGADAEDVAQEAFLRLYRSLSRIDPDRPLEAWMVRVTVNAARNQRDRAPSRREAPLAAAGQPAARRAGGFDRIASDDLRRVLSEALEVVTLREREVFLLRDVHGLAAGVVAGALGIAAVTVRRLSMSGRRKVRAYIEERHPELLGGEDARKRVRAATPQSR